MKKISKKDKHFLEMLDDECEHGANDGTKQRIQKLETAVFTLFGLFIGHLLGTLLSKLLF